MDQLRYFDAISAEYGHVIALAVVQVCTINLVLKFKKNDWTENSTRLERIEKKALKVLWHLSETDFALVMRLWKITHKWNSYDLFDNPKTFAELLLEEK